jgi:predicted nuclease of restriction endonuclease-like RecB superfamily
VLTPELVHARRKGDELQLVRLGARRPRALSLAGTIAELAHAHVGRTRGELEEAWSAVDAAPRDRKLWLGLCKLAEDALVFETEAEADPVALRREVFRRAAEARRALGARERFDREALLRQIAAERNTEVAAIERALYADLKSAQVLREVKPLAPQALVDRYDLAQAQAILLRATRVVARFESGLDPSAVRALLRRLKFLRLLVSVHREESGGVQLEIDGPFSLFESVTKYGLALALALPAIAACGRHRIVAEVRWGKQRLPLRFVLEDAGGGAGADLPIRLSDDAEALHAKLVERAAKEGYEVRIADAILDLPGVGACVPDLAVRECATGRTVYVEVLGFWSRDAVWKRVELVEKGLGAPILFCASARLRVSERVLPEDGPASLLVYKGAIPVGAVLERIGRLLARVAPP